MRWVDAPRSQYVYETALRQPIKSVEIYYVIKYAMLSTRTRSNTECKTHVPTGPFGMALTSVIRHVV